MYSILRNLFILSTLVSASLIGDCSMAFGQDPIAVATELTVNDIEQMILIQNDAIKNAPTEGERVAHTKMRHMLVETQNRLFKQRDHARTLATVVPAPVVVAPVTEEKPSCCSSKKTTPTGTCCGKPKASCCCKEKSVEEHIVYLVDNTEFAGETEGLNGQTCNGPLHVGGTRVWAKGSEASVFAGVLHRRALDDRQATVQGLLAQRCAMPSCIGFLPSCRGFLPGPSAFPIGPGFIGGPAVIAGPPPHGSGCSGFCPCAEHAAAVRLRYGPAADPSRYGCMCPQPCRSCAGNMTYIAGP